MLVLSDELDGGTGQLLPLGVRKIIGGYCGPVIQTNLDHAQPGMRVFVFPFVFRVVLVCDFVCRRVLSVLSDAR